MLTHILNVAVHTLLELPVGADFRSLFICKVGERATSRDAVSAFDLLKLRCVHWHVIIIPRLGWLEGVWSLRSLQVLDLAPHLSSTSHNLLDLYVVQHTVLLLFHR